MHWTLCIACGAVVPVLTAVRESGRALGVDLCLWVARDLARVAVAWAYRRCTHPFGASHGSRDNHDFYLVVSIQSRDSRVHGIITLEDINPIICESHNSLSPGIDGAIPLKQGHTTPCYTGKPPSKIVEQGPAYSPWCSAIRLHSSAILAFQLRSMSRA